MSSSGGSYAITVYQTGDAVPPAPTPKFEAGDYGKLGCAVDLADGIRVRQRGGRGRETGREAEDRESPNPSVAERPVKRRPTIGGTKEELSYATRT